MGSISALRQHLTQQYAVFTRTVTILAIHILLTSNEAVKTFVDDRFLFTLKACTIVTHLNFLKRHLFIISGNRALETGSN